MYATLLANRLIVHVVRELQRQEAERVRRREEERSKAEKRDVKDEFEKPGKPKEEKGVHLMELLVSVCVSGRMVGADRAGVDLDIARELCWVLRACRSLEILLRLHRDMAVDYLQVRVTTAKKLGPHNCPE